MDLAKPQTFNRTYDWVISTSVGEFIPKKFEQIYFENIVKPVKEGLVISWRYKLKNREKANDQKSREEVARMITPYGFVLDEVWSFKLRKSTRINWYAKGLMVFRKIHDSISENGAGEDIRKEL